MAGCLSQQRVSLSLSTIKGVVKARDQKQAVSVNLKSSLPAQPLSFQHDCSLFLPSKKLPHMRLKTAAVSDETGSVPIARAASIGIGQRLNTAACN